MYIRTIQVNLSVYFFKASAVSILIIVGSKESSSSSPDDKTNTSDSFSDTELMELEGTSICFIGVTIGFSGTVIAEVPNSNSKLIV